MNISIFRPLILVVLVTCIVGASTTPAHAAPSAPVLLKAGKAEGKLGKLIPSVKFEPRAKLGKTGAQVSLTAVLSFAGKTKRISIFDMGLKKKGKSVRVKRKIGKLKVSLTVSWSGSREIVIKGSARYLKFKVPVPKLRLKV